MKSMQHVLWRGALALGLMMIGIGSGVSLPAAGDAAPASACALGKPSLLAEVVHPQTVPVAPADAS